jgi:hypothetical protein
VIEFILIFEENGLLIQKLDFTKPKTDPAQEPTSLDDLITGFFSALFTYFSDNFGKLQSIFTQEKMILTQKVNNLYIALVGSLYDPQIKSDKVRFTLGKEIWLANKRLEEIAVGVLYSISKIMKEALNEGFLDPLLYSGHAVELGSFEAEIFHLVSIGEDRAFAIKGIMDEKIQLLTELCSLSPKTGIDLTQNTYVPPGPPPPII